MLRGRLSFDIPRRRGRNISSFSPAAEDFVSALLQPDPEERLSAKQALKHPWIARQSSSQEGKSGHGHSAGKDSKVSKRQSDREREWFSEVSARINEFAALPKVKRTILAALARQLTEDQARAQTKLFRDMDRDGDGKIGLDEMRTAGMWTLPYGSAYYFMMAWSLRKRVPLPHRFLFV